MVTRNCVATGKDSSSSRCQGQGIYIVCWYLRLDPSLAALGLGRLEGLKNRKHVLLSHPGSVVA